MVIENGQVKNDYNGHKYRPTGETTLKVDAWGYATEKEEFIPTKAYMSYLRDLEFARDRFEIKRIKEKCLYQLEKFGEVEYLTKLEYQAMCRKFGYSCKKFEELIA